MNFVDEIAENVDQEDHDLEFVKKTIFERRKPDFERRKQRFSTLKRGFKTSKNNSERRKKDFKSSKFEVYKRRKTILNVEQMIVKDELRFWTLINVSYRSTKTIQNVE